jgi:hypothetical protein
MIHQVRHNLNREFVTLPEIDERTGEYRVKSLAKILEPGSVHELPDDFAARMIAHGSMRELSKEELQLHKLSQGPS